jgi:hypothetical protein
MQANRQRLGTINFRQRARTLEQTLDAEGFSRDSFGGIHVARRLTTPCRSKHAVAKLAKRSTGIIELVVFSGPLGRDHRDNWIVTTQQPVSTHAEPSSDAVCPVAGVPMILSGWSCALQISAWSHHQLLIISALMAIFDISLLALLYRDLRLWVIG